MNIQEYINYAKRVLNEDAGSEGMVYQVKAKSGLNEIANDVLVIEKIETENGEMTAEVKFAYPHDYGFAVSAIKNALTDIEIISVTLVY